MAIDWEKRAEEWIGLLRDASKESATQLLAHYLRSAEIDGALNVIADLRKLNVMPDDIVVIQ